MPGDAGREQRRVRDGHLHELARRPVEAEVSAQVRLEVAGIGLEVREPAHVVQQLAKRDVLAVRDEAGQPPLDAVGEVELAFGDELEHDGRV